MNEYFIPLTDFNEIRNLISSPREQFDQQAKDYFSQHAQSFMFLDNLNEYKFVSHLNQVTVIPYHDEYFLVVVRIISGVYDFFKCDQLDGLKHFFENYLPNMVDTSSSNCNFTSLLHSVNMRNLVTDSFSSSLVSSIGGSITCWYPSSGGDINNLFLWHRHLGNNVKPNLFILSDREYNFDNKTITWDQQELLDNLDVYSCAVHIDLPIGKAVYFELFGCGVLMICCQNQAFYNFALENQLKIPAFMSRHPMDSFISDGNYDLDILEVKEVLFGDGVLVPDNTKYELVNQFHWNTLDEAGLRAGDGKLYARR
jgi:hypothetical protein